MKSLLKFALVGLLVSFGFAQQTTKPETSEKKEAPKTTKEVTVIMSTSLGDVHIEMDSKNAPKTVANFLKYVDAGFYDGTIFHRVIDGFMIQGGGFSVKEDRSFERKKTNPPVVNESPKTASNKRGTIAMARTSDPDSATSQFFINVGNNDETSKFADLDYPNSAGHGYAVFGKVTKGMDVVDKIKAVETGIRNRMRDVPKADVTIKSVKRAK